MHWLDAQTKGERKKQKPKEKNSNRNKQGRQSDQKKKKKEWQRAQQGAKNFFWQNYSTLYTAQVKRG